MTKTPQEMLAELTQSLTGALPVVKVEKLKKADLGGKTPGHKPLSENGGAREGSGRQPGGTQLQRRLNRQLMWEHFGEQVKVKVRDPLTGVEKIIDKPRVIVQIERLFLSAVNKDGTYNDAAIDRWLNRALGKAPQPLIGDEEEDPVRIDLGIERILDKAYGDTNPDEE